MGHKPRGILGHGGGGRAPRHYSKFLTGTEQIGLWIVGGMAAFLLFIFLLIFI